MSSSQPDNYNSAEGTSNALILSVKKQKKKSAKATSEKPVNRKKIDAIQKRKQARESKISKTKAKKLLRIAALKKKKQSRESLFESLKQYQLPIESFKNLESTAGSHKGKTTDLPKKLKSLAGRGSITASGAKGKHEQENYFETDSESEPEENLEIHNSPIKAQQDTEPVFLEVVTPENSQKSPCTENDEDSSKIKATVFSQSEERANCKLAKKIDDKVEKFTTKYVAVKRTDEIEMQRSKLPIYSEEQTIIEAINENTAVIICGETGSGKTTQLPQFLYEAGYASEGKLIGITEPRRVAAISMAERVSVEMNMPEAVSYQIRYESSKSDKTRILFMTDGVLMKELQRDVSLAAYSVIIIDEAHERSMFSDVLIGLLTRIVEYRKKANDPLKLIIMSATLRLDDFMQKMLFPKSLPPVLKIDARQYPVTIHFERRTPENYVTAAFKKICKIHEKLPPGTILVFVSGRIEVITLLKWLSARYPIKSKKHLFHKRMNKRKIDDTLNVAKKKKVKNSCITEKVVAEERFSEIDDSDNAEHDSEYDIESTWDNDELNDVPRNTAPLLCLPLYSLLSSEKQRRVFQPAPDGQRVCVVATNVAETSLTIPLVRYIVDSGREKRRSYDPVSGVSKFEVKWISQASADQRAGRAGRVQAGHVYRLYSSAVFSDLEKFTPPEILTKPIDQLVLQLKSMNIVKVVNFPFPTPPDKDALEEAEVRLSKLGALEMAIKNNLKEARISTLGKTLCVFPLSPCFAKMLVMANQRSLLPYMCCLVAALSVREPLVSLYSLRGETSEATQSLMLEKLKQRKSWCASAQARRLGDLTVLLTAILKCEQQKATELECVNFGVRHKALIEVRKLRQQLSDIINSVCNLERPITVDFNLKVPSEEELRLLRQIVVASLCENIVKKVDVTSNENVPKGAYQNQKLEEYIYIDPSSVIYKDEPDWLLYQEIVEVKGRKCMQNVIVVESEWLPKLSSAHCQFSEVKDADPKYNVANDAMEMSYECNFGTRHWPLGHIERPMPNNILLYRHFARFFLQGSVCPSLSKYADKLLTSPLSMTKNWARLQQRTENLLNALIQHEAVSRERLLKVWKDKSEYLLDEYLQWIPQYLHEEVQFNWPPN